MAFNTGATFIPGGDDSYYMPEVVAPAPHRAGEHPNDMRQNVAYMEQEAQARTPRYSTASQQPIYNNSQHTTSWNNPYSPSNYSPNDPNSATSPKIYGNHFQSPSWQQQNPHLNGLSETPNFSPFPILRNPGPNIPPTDDQKGAVLEAAREAVLGCNDPDQQLTWAQDALTYVEIAIQNESRISRTQPARPRTPTLEHVLRDDAIKVVNFLADQHHPKAEFMRGMWYEFGKFGFPLDKPESFKCYKTSSERGYARAWYRMGMQFESGNDPLKAIKYYRMAADVGDSAACYRLGMMTLLGQHGQMQDFERGLQLIYAAAHTADENAPQGAYVLGMLQAGELTQVQVPERFLPRDIPGAKMNIERAAFLGFAKAQVRMGAAYELCELGCDFNPALSLHYNALAARQGEIDADMAISKWFLCGHEGVFEKNEEMAFTYAQRAAVDGLPTAQFAMGYFYEVGIYVSMDLAKAKEWYRKADEGGNKDARKRIDAVSRSKTISRKDHESVALQRIRNQHGGSQSGQLPQVPEATTSTVDMPDPSKLSLNTNPDPRPASVAPYPTGQNRLSVGQPDFRPSSAFGINPNLRPMSAAPAPLPRYDSYPTHAGPINQRPYSSIDQPPVGPGYGRGRVPSGPPHLATPGLQPPGPRPSTTSPQVSPYIAPQGTPRPGPPPHVNSAPPPSSIGFTAPIDTAGADRPNWAPLASGSGEGRRPAVGRKDAHPPRTTSGQRPLPSQQAGKPSTNTGYQSSNRPPTTQPSQPKPPPQNIKPAKVTPSKAPASGPVASNAQRPSKVAASTASSRPPGKGPKTFEEMGVPTAQKESDCVIM